MLSSGNKTFKRKTKYKRNNIIIYIKYSQLSVCRQIMVIIVQHNYTMLRQSQHTRIECSRQALFPQFSQTSFDFGEASLSSLVVDASIWNLHFSDFSRYWYCLSNRRTGFRAAIAVPRNISLLSCTILDSPLILRSSTCGRARFIAS